MIKADIVNKVAEVSEVSRQVRLEVDQVEV